MGCEGTDMYDLGKDGKVLILVLVEVGLWEIITSLREWNNSVLILVLVEVGLWESFQSAAKDAICVLILVLVEVGLWV